MARNGSGRTIVVGLDGAGFDLLDPWIEAGELPTIRRILDEGVSGELESVLPPVTSPNWKAYSTGKNPGKIGIFWWRNVDAENRRVYLPTERYHHNTEYWEILAQREAVGVLGVPTTYPPKSVGSFVVSGAPDADEEGFTHPPSLEHELKERFDYRVTNRHSLSDGTEEAYEEVLDLVDQRFVTAKYLMEKHDLSFLQVTTFYINALHHHIWDHEYTLRGWRIIDDHLESLLDGDDDVILMSDHGHNEIRTVFRINRWLEREGYLTFDRTVSDTFYRLGFTTDRLRRAIDRVGPHLPGVDLRDAAERYTPRWILDHLPNDRGELRASKHSRANWDETEALASAQGPIYLTPDRGTDRYDRLRTELVERIEGLTDHRGRPVARAVHRGEDVYSGRYVEEAPDLVIEHAPGTHIAEHIGDRPVFDDEDDTWRGVNKRYGLFAATGPSFATGTVEDMSILDLAPTILHLRGCPVPSDMDGQVRSSVFAEDSAPTTREVQYGTADPGEVDS